MAPADHRPSSINQTQYVANLTLAGLAGQVGCLTLGVILAALFAGLWLDNVLHTKPMFTLVLVLGSMPVALWLMYRLAMSAVSRIKPPASPTPRVPDDEKSDP